MNRFLKLTTFAVWTVMLMSLLSGAVHAQEPTSFDAGKEKLLENVVKGTGLAEDASASGILTKIITWLLSITAVLALAALIIGGIMYIVSLGDEKRTASAKRIIIFAIVGLLVVGVSFVIIEMVKNLLTR